VREPSQIEVAGQVLDKPIARLDDFNGVSYVILRHPDCIIPPHIWAWVEDYEYTTEYRVPVPYQERHPCWLDMRKLWDQLIRRLRK
jgi:hypothetical protein